MKLWERGYDTPNPSKRVSGLPLFGMKGFFKVLGSFRVVCESKLQKARPMVEVEVDQTREESCSWRKFT